MTRAWRSGIRVMTMATQPWQPMPPPPPQKSNTLRIVLIVVGSVLALCCIGGVVGGVVLFKGVKTAIGPVQDATDEFITDLEKGDTTAAYALLCRDTRSAYPQATFADVMLFITSSSAPMVYAPNDSPISQFRSMVNMAESLIANR